MTITVNVTNGDVNKAMREVKKQGQKGGLFREAKLRKHRLKPSEKRARDAAESKKRIAKQNKIKKQ